MANNQLQDVIGGVDERYIAELYEQLTAHMHVRRKRIRRMTTAASIVLVFGLGLWGAVTHINSIHKTDSFTLPVDRNQIIWKQETDATTTSAGPADISVNEAMVLMIQSGWQMDDELFTALSMADANRYLAIEVRRSYNPTDRMSFTYQGKTRGQWEVERDYNQRQLEKLTELQKEGELLKYGEALYTTLDLNGNSWSQEIYEKRIDYYGVHFLSQYIVNGEFLAEKAARDASTATETERQLHTLMLDLEDAYRAACAEEMLPEFKNLGFSCTIRNGSLYLFVTKEELFGVPLTVDKKAYMLRLASRLDFDMQTDYTTAAATPPAS